MLPIRMDDKYSRPTGYKKFTALMKRHVVQSTARLRTTTGTVTIAISTLLTIWILTCFNAWRLGNNFVPVASDNILASLHLVNHHHAAVRVHEHLSAAVSNAQLILNQELSNALPSISLSSEGKLVDPVSKDGYAKLPVEDGGRRKAYASLDGTQQHVKVASDTPTPNSHSNFAIAIKTGSDIASRRVPIAMMTFLKNAENVLILADGPGVWVGDMLAADVISEVNGPKSPKTKSRKGFQNINLIHPPHDQGRNGVNPDNNAEGWKLDAKKNIPGIQNLYARYPEAEWFIMIDDDTYVFLENLQHALSAYDPKQPFLFGNPSRFVGCDGVRDFSESPLFAHGGSGIVLSKAAVEAILPIADTCVTKYDVCKFGDVRLSLCLRDAGILLERRLNGVSGFNSGPPTSTYDFMPNPCFRPLTYHHLLPEHIQNLHNIERSSMHPGGHGFVTLADVWDGTVGYSMSDEEIVKNTDRIGADMENIPVTTPDECHEKCLEIPTCLAFSTNGADCYVKYGIPGISEKTGFYSGVIASRYTCSSSADVLYDEQLRANQHGQNPVPNIVLGKLLKHDGEEM